MAKAFHMLITVAALVVTVYSNNIIKPPISILLWEHDEEVTVLSNILQFVHPVYLLMNFPVTVYNDIKTWYTEAELLAIMKELQAPLSEMNAKADKIINQQAATMDMLHKLPELLRHVLHLTEMERHITDLNTIYQTYAKHSNNMTKYSKRTHLKFAYSLLSHRANDIDDILVQMHAIVFPPHSALRKKGMLGFMASTLIKDAPFQQMGQLNQFPLQVFLQFYGYMATARIRGMNAKFFGFSILKLYKCGSHIAEADLFYRRFVRQMKQELVFLNNIVKSLPRVMWKSDPIVHGRGETFDEISYLVQAYIQNEYDLNKESCRSSCRKLSESAPIKDLTLCTSPVCRRVCKNMVNIGEYVGSSMRVWIRNTNEDNRRYSLVITNKGRVMGKKETGDKEVTVKDGWSWGYTCKFCLIMCDDDWDGSNRFFNLRPVMADFKNNWVVTGLQFVRRNRMFYLKIQEGKLLPNYTIDPKTVRWLTPKNYQLNDTNMKQGRDYHKLTYYHRKMFLDDIFAEKGHVLIGVRFEVTSHLELRLSVATSSYDSKTGVLAVTGDEKPKWIRYVTNATRKHANKYTNQPSFVIKRTSSKPFDNPTEVTFLQTTWEGDFCQRTTPSLDMQPVESIRPIPLGGCGVYYKAENVYEYGGFIAPKIIAYDIG